MTRLIGCASSVWRKSFSPPMDCIAPTIITSSGSGILPMIAVIASRQTSICRIVKALSTINARRLSSLAASASIRTMAQPMQGWACPNNAAQSIFAQ
ncbi:hypothetical protein V6R86_00180 [Sphingomonas kaistensis]|uniref:Uncharacterized protein n=1 Tax=Sphingomonas kaistensis TaxID=298708 RepID=A0ABZ2FXW9_9SPHN